jgi:hypothetical protein
VKWIRRGRRNKGVGGGIGGVDAGRKSRTSRQDIDRLLQANHVAPSISPYFFG